MLLFVVIQMVVSNTKSFADVSLIQLSGMSEDPGTYLSQHRANTFNHSMSYVS